MLAQMGCKLLLFLALGNAVASKQPSASHTPSLGQVSQSSLQARAKPRRQTTKAVAAALLLAMSPANAFQAGASLRDGRPSNLRLSRVLRGGSRAKSPVALFGQAGGGKSYGGKAVMGEEEIMSKKEHGTSKTPVQQNLRWGCDVGTADRICNFNRHFAEYSTYWERETSFLQNPEKNEKGEVDFHDSNTGNLLFTAPKGRSYDDFVAESKSHGWPSFRDEEVNWDYVRVLPDGECVSVDGTHLGHNLPDMTGNRYCINLVSVAGTPDGEK